MSRYLQKRIDGVWEETLEDMNKCSWLVDDVCCNGDAESFGNFPSDEDCETCHHFTAEDGLSIRSTVCHE